MGFSRIRQNLRKARRHRLGLAPAMALLFGACTPHHPDYFGTVVPRHPPDELWINNGGEPEWIDPGKCSDVPGGEIIDNLFAGLVEAHPKTLEPMPDIAERWETSPDGRTYTFHLRDATWSDGTPLTAADFAWSWKRVLDPATASRYGTMLHILQGGQAFNEKALWVTYTGDRAPGSATAGTISDIEVRQTFEKLGTVASVEATQTGAAPGFFVFFGGADTDKAAFLRAGQALNGTLLNGATLQVRLADSSVVGVDAVDARTLVVKLAAPVPYFLHLAAFHTLMPVPRHVLERLQTAGKNPDLWTRPEYIVSNGAYTLSEWHFKHYFVYEKNPRYWNAAAVRVPRIKVLEVDSYNTALNLYRTGEIDWLGRNTPIPSEFITHLAPFKDTHRDAELSVYFYWLNTKEPPLDNLKVRQALSLAIDRQSLVAHVLRAGQIATADLVPDGLAGYHGLRRPIFDAVRARALLHEAGYPGGANLPPITLIYNTSESHKQIAEALQAMWKTNLGIDVQIENQEWKVFLKNIEMRNFQMARMGWVGDYPDPNTFLHDLLMAHAGNNNSGWADPAFDALIERANRQSDPNVRLSLMHDAEARAMAAQPLIPFYVYTRSYLLKPYVKGFWSNYLDRHALKYFWIDRRFYQGVPATGVDDPPPAMTGAEG